VQHPSEAAYQPGASNAFYYVDSAGYLCRRNLVTGKYSQIAKIGTRYSQIAVSPDGKYLAALRDGSLYTGPLDGPLAKRQGSGYTTISWDRTDNLWTTTSAGQILAFRGGVSPGSAQARPITAEVPPPDGGLVTAVRIAPDGVRVALIIDGDQLTFGAIVWQQGPGPGLASAAAKIDLSPFSVGNTDFTAVTWYGPNDVITLGGPGSTLTEYPVNGGTSTSQMLDQSVSSIAASSGQALIAGVAKDGMLEAPSLTGAWAPVVYKGVSPTYPG
jgi:WD40 repeat protein